MKFKLIALSAISILAATSTMANTVNDTSNTVYGGTVHFRGQLVNSACIVSTESANQTVNLGQNRIARLTVAGAKTGVVPFQIKLVDCNPKVQATASVSFYGQTVADNPKLLTVATNNNVFGAKNVGIEVVDNRSKILDFTGSDYSTVQKLSLGTNILNFGARYVATGGAATAGVANADATFVVRYE